MPHQSDYSVITIDESGNKSIYPGIEVTTITSDDKFLPMADNFLSTVLSSSGFTINWKAGSDNLTSTTDLSYLVCSGSDLIAIDAVTKCERSVIEKKYSINMTSLNLVGKTEGTPYFYKVIIQDKVGNKSIYPGIKIIPIPLLNPNKISTGGSQTCVIVINGELICSGINAGEENLSFTKFSSESDWSMISNGASPNDTQTEIPLKALILSLRQIH